jgi:hypothetical protein
MRPGPNLRINPAFAWGDRRKLRKPVVRIDDVQLEIQTEHSLNANLKCYGYTNLLSTCLTMDSISYTGPYARVNVRVLLFECI